MFIISYDLLKKRWKILCIPQHVYGFGYINFYAGVRNDVKWKPPKEGWLKINFHEAMCDNLVWT